MANEKRLIDANALMDSFREYMVERYDKEKCVSEENCKTCDKPCLWRKIVRSAPTVSAVEVKHGEWIYEEKPDENNNIQARCSVCFAGDLHATALMNKVPYCWKCGAEMDGDGNAER